MWNARLDEAQAEIKIAKRNINNLRYTYDTTLMTEQRGTEEPGGLWSMGSHRVGHDCSNLAAASAYLRLSASASSSPAFLMMYSAYKLNKEGDNIQSWRTPFPIWNQSVVPCPVLTVASWPAYRFLKRQVRWSGIPVSLRIFQFVVIHTVKGFGIVNKVDDFLELLLFWWSNECWQFDLRFLCLF